MPTSAREAPTDGGLRERKRARTRRHIAATAARLFAEHGYEGTAIAEVARVAELSEQTVYNYFPTKESLVVDRDDEVRERFVAAVRARPPGVTPPAALRPVALDLVEHMRGLDPEEARGTIGHLATRSPAVRRLALDTTDRLADALAEALAAEATPSEVTPWHKLQGVALAWISQTVIDGSGRLVREGWAPAEVADRLGPDVAELVDRLDRAWPSL